MLGEYFIITVIHRLLTLTHKMKSFVVVLSVLALAAADVAHLRSPEADAQTIEEKNDVGIDGFAYVYKTNNGIEANEQGQLKVVAPDQAAIVVQGGNSYTSPEGQVIQLTYVADENGYQPQGAHLPTPPPAQPIPDYILRSLEFIAAHPPQPEQVRRI